MYGIRGSASGFVSRSRSAATASRRSSFQLVTDQTSAETPQSLANTSAASITHGSETPEPNRLTFGPPMSDRSEEHTSELQSRFDLVCRLLLEKKKRALQDPTVLTCSP